jgi:hypothetical protein
MTPQDREALQRALQLEAGDVIDQMVRARGWEDAARWAASVCQIRNLKLHPWECEPAGTDNVEVPTDSYGTRQNEVALLRRMLDLGLSRFEPDPLAAIERVERERAA